MRAILLAVLVAGFAFWGLFNPMAALLAYVSFGLSRPEYIAFVTAGYPFSAILAVSMILGSWKDVLENAWVSWVQNPVVWIFVLLQAPLAASAATALRPDVGWAAYTEFFKMSVALLWIPVLVTSLDRMRMLVLVSAVSLGIHGVWQAIGGVLTGGRAITHGIGGFMSDNNTFAAGLTMVFPFCWYGTTLVTRKWQKVTLHVMWASCLFTIMLTHSRGAALAAGVVVFLVAWSGKRRVLTVTLLLIAMIPALYLVGDSYRQRIGTIQTYEADESAMSRIIHYRIAWELALRNPLFGVGIGHENYFIASEPFTLTSEYKVHRLVVHNSFLQMLVHSGFIALFLFCLLFSYCTIAMWRSAKRMVRMAPELEVYPRSLMLSIIGYLVASITQPRATFDFAYQLTMYCAAWLVVERQLMLQAAREQMEAGLGDPQPQESWGGGPHHGAALGHPASAHTGGGAQVRWS